MKKDCECSYCIKNVNDYFCISCGYNFNECEVIHKFNDLRICPKCHPKVDDFYNVRKQMGSFNWINLERNQ